MDRPGWRDDPAARPPTDRVVLTLTLTFCERSALIGGDSPGSQDAAPVEVTEATDLRFLKDLGEQAILLAHRTRERSSR